jgi:hypothetical protein
LTKKTSPTNTRPRAVQVTTARGKAAALPRRKPRDMTGDFQNPTADLASLPAAPNLKFEREDWTSFRTIEGLMQKAGVAKSKLPRLVLKELADNALDTGAKVKIGRLPEMEDAGYFVEDAGPNIDGTPEDIARLFSIHRPMISSKYLRLPQTWRTRQWLTRRRRCRPGQRRQPHRHHPRQAH